MGQGGLNMSKFIECDNILVNLDNISTINIFNYNEYQMFPLDRPLDVDIKNPWQILIKTTNQYSPEITIRFKYKEEREKWYNNIADFIKSGTETLLTINKED